MAASRRLYVRIAEGLRRQCPDGKCSPEERGKWEDCVLAVADALAQDNGNFNRERFTAACGL